MLISICIKSNISIFIKQLNPGLPQAVHTSCSLLIALGRGALLGLNQSTQCPAYFVCHSLLTSQGRGALVCLKQSMPYMYSLLTSQGRGAQVCLKQSMQCAAYLYHRVEVLWSARSSLHSVRLTYITGERGSGLPEAVHAL
jgi:hypothetical protein